MRVPTGVWKAVTHLVAVVASFLLVLVFTAVLPFGLGSVVSLGMIVAVGLVAGGVLEGPAVRLATRASAPTDGELQVPLDRPRPWSDIGYWCAGAPREHERRRPGRDHGPVHSGLDGAGRCPVPRLGEQPGGDCAGRARACPPPCDRTSSRGGRDRGGGDAGADGRRGPSWGRERVRVDAAGLPGLAVAWRGGHGLPGPVGGRGRTWPGVLGGGVIALTYLVPAAGRAIEARATMAGDAEVMAAGLGGVFGRGAGPQRSAVVLGASSATPGLAEVGGLNGGETGARGSGSASAPGAQLNCSLVVTQVVPIGHPRAGVVHTAAAIAGMRLVVHAR